jgi:curved DNA-binding protein
VRDYYAILGVPRTATAAEIDAAFRTLARSCHPDLRPEEEEKNATAEFKLATEAYEVLSNIEKRREHDRATRPRRPLAALRNAFSSRATKSKLLAEPLRGPFDVEADLHLVPEEAHRGGIVEFQISVSVPCDCCCRQLNLVCEVCGGTGTSMESRTMHLQVPAGLQDGELLRIPGLGRAVSLGGPRGDIYLRIRVRPCW